MKCFLQAVLILTWPVIGLSQIPGSGFQVRLSDGTASTGRLEVQINGGPWGTVCSDGFDDLAATVVCQQLHYKWGNALKAKDQFDVGQGPIHMDDVRCQGSEVNLLGCLHKAWGDNNCVHNEDAAVACTNNTVQLKNGANNHGIVYVLEDNNKWSVLCGEGFSQPAARVVCRQLGYADGLVTPSGTYKAIQDHRRAFVRPNIQCMGTEVNVQSCGFFGECSKTEYNYASVVCFNEPIRKGISVRISGVSETSASGVVEVQLAGIWGSVCGSHWDDNDANVACKSAGYRGGVAYNVQPESPRTPYVLGAVNCRGSETSLQSCPLGETMCKTSGNMEVAGVLCHSSFSKPALRLVEERPLYGRLEMEVDGVVGGVCDDRWDSIDAGIACRQMGYADGDSIHGLSAPYSRKLMGHVECVKREETIFECPNSGWQMVNHSTCGSYGNFAGVRCYPHAFLANEQRSLRSRSGSPLVFDKGRWYHICDRGFDYNEANAVCRELGFTNGVPLISQSVSEDNQFRIFFAAMKCPAQAPDVRACEVTAVSSCQSELLSPSAYATVLCINETMAQANVKVYPPSGISSPVVEIFGLNGTICSSGWDDHDATVYCKEFGYTEGHASSSQKYVGDPIHNPIVWMTNLNCTGSASQTSLRNCDASLNKDSGPCSTGIALAWCS